MTVGLLSHPDFRSQGSNRRMPSVFGTTGESIRVKTPPIDRADREAVAWLDSACFQTREILGFGFWPLAPFLLSLSVFSFRLVDSLFRRNFGNGCGKLCPIPYAEAMRSIVKSPPPTNPAGQSSPQWEELAQIPEPTQLDNIKAQLDLVLLALESLAGIGSDAMLRVATELNLESMVADRVTLWRLRQSNPLRKGQGGRKKLDIEEARSLVLISCYLAKQHQALIRRAVALLEQMTEQNREPHTVSLLGDYIDTFSNTYAERMEDAEELSSDALTNLALKLLIDLLFYSSSGGHRRLWLALLDRAKH